MANNDITWSRQPSGTIRVNPPPPAPVPEMLPTDPPPFDLDGFFNEWHSTAPVEEYQPKKEAFASVMSELTRPFLSQGYNTMAAMNRGVAAFSVHMDSIANFLEANGVGESSGVFDTAAKQLEENAEYWQRRVDEVGINFVDEVISEAVGEAIPGITTFALDVASGYTFPFMAAAGENPENPVSAGLLAAAKTGTLHGLFKMINPLRQYLRAPVMGSIFGIEDAAQAPEGQKGRQFTKGFLKGVGYSVTSPGGRLGLNEIVEGINKELPVFMQNQKGAVTLPPTKGAPPPVNTPATTPPSGIPPDAPGTRQRKFIKTVEESPEAAEADPRISQRAIRAKQKGKIGPGVKQIFNEMPSLAEKVAGVDPQKYTILTNAETVAKVKDRIATDGLQSVVDFVKSDAKPSAEKGAAFVELMKEFNRRGDFDRAVEMTELYDAELRANGQFVQAASLWSKNTPQAFIKWGNKQLDSVRKRYSWLDTATGRRPESFTLTPAEQKEIMDLHRKASQMPEGPDKADLSLQMVDVVAKKVPPSVSELFDACRYQNMLSSPRTHARNISENLFNTFITRPYDITTIGAVDYTKSLFTGKHRKIYVSDVPVYLKAAINAVPNAMVAFRETWKMGNYATMEKPEIGIEAKNAFEASRTRQIPKALTVVPRFMESCDKFNAALIGAGETARLVKRGMPPEEAYRKASSVSESYLYRDKLDPEGPGLSYPSKALSSLGVLLQESRKMPVLGPISKWYVPFLRTPINKTIQMMERSPLGLARDPKTLADSEVLGKILGGSIITGIGAMMASTNETTWAPPTRKEDKEWFYATARKPYSVKINDTWVPFWYLGPFALSFGLPAAAKYYYEDRPEALTDGRVEKLFALSEGVGKFVGSQSSTQSVGSLFSALSGDIDYKFSSQTGFTVQQLIPGSALVRYVNTILDPVYRHPKGFIEKIEANLPILSDDLDARMTPYFEESVRDPINYFLPYDVGRVNQEYEVQYPYQEMKSRQEYLNNQMESITRRLRTGELTFEESLDEQTKIIEAGPKVAK